MVSDLVASRQPVACLTVLSEVIDTRLTELTLSLRDVGLVSSDPVPLIDAAQGLAQIQGALLMIDQSGLAAIAQLVRDQLITSAQHRTAAQYSSELIVKRFQTLLRQVVEHLLRGHAVTAGELLHFWHQQLTIGGPTTLQPSLLVALDIDQHRLTDLLPDLALPEVSDDVIIDPDQSLLNLLRSQDDLAPRQAARQIASLFAQAAAQCQQRHESIYWRAVQACLLEYASLGGDAVRIKRIAAAGVRLLRQREVENASATASTLASLTRDALFELAQQPVQSALARVIVTVFRLEQQFSVPTNSIAIDSTREEAFAAWNSALNTLIAAIEVQPKGMSDPTSWAALVDTTVVWAPLSALGESLKDLLDQIATQSLEPIHAEGLAAGLCCLRDSVDIKALLVIIQTMKQLLVSPEPRHCLQQLGQQSRTDSTHHLFLKLVDAMRSDMTQLEQLLDAEPPVAVVTTLKAAAAVLTRIAGALQLLDLIDERGQVMQLRDALPTQAVDLWIDQTFAQQWVLLQTSLAQLPWRKTLQARQAFQPEGTLDSIFIEEARALIQSMRDCAAASDFAGLVQTAHTLGGCSATVGLSGLAELSLTLESTLEQSLARESTMDAALLDTVLVTVSCLLEDFEDHGARGNAPELVQALRQHLLAPVCVHADQVEDLSVADLVKEATDLIHSQAPCDVSIDATHHSAPIVNESGAVLKLAEAIDAAPSPPTAPAPAPSAGPSPAPSISTLHLPSPLPPTPIPAKDGLNRSVEHDELYELFRLEAADLLPQLDDAMRQWQQHPEDSSQPAQLLRVLHTLKGSARMAGRDDLGTEFHHAEAEVSALMQQSSGHTAHAIGDLLRRVDCWIYALTQVATVLPQHLSMTECSTAIESSSDSEMGLVTEPAFKNPAIEQPALHTRPDRSDASVSSPQVRAEIRSPMLRVRADRLAQFADTSAEIWRSNARLREVLQGQRRSFADISEDVSRLRAHLHELEMEAESRVLARASQGVRSDFDPLEFDRYTRLHELTRMMAESITDIVSVQRGMLGQLEQLTTAAAEQQRDLRRQQAELHALRSQPLHSVEARLRHVLQQAAREVGCEVALGLHQGSVEIERELLDRLLGPLEHLLRNAVVHGIEQVQQRLSLGKPANGLVMISAALTGNELQLIVQDDGRGLDLHGIRQRALAAGLLQVGDDLDERALSTLIFAPGLSTASEVTTLSGRGIGMDAVRAELHALGGQIEVESEAGQGCRFTLRVPVGLTSIMVVLVRAGQWRVGLPAALLKQALQLDAAMIRSGGQPHQIDWQGMLLPLRHLGQTLGDNSSSVSQDRVPVAILSDGDKAVALQLDAIEGQRELIVKHPGPQLSRVPGLSGASVLADGAIALIIHPLRLPQALPLPSLSVPERQLPTVLVVDDSLTVRRASQRLLERHGYMVALARDGVEALNYLRDASAAVILLDIEMPRMDGFELLATLRDDVRCRDIPVVMITSRMADRHRQRAQQLGASGYMGKPYREEALLALLSELRADNLATKIKSETVTD